VHIARLKIGKPHKTLWSPHALDSDGKIAEISIEPETGKVKHIVLFSNLRFKCQRCATFCCKLGGPRLSSKDVEQLKKAGLTRAEFLDATNGRLKSMVSGSCVFLKFDSQKQFYECTVYPYRPALCRLYPFHIEKTSSDRFVLKLLPCKGINRRLGAVIDERFLIDNVLGLLFALSRPPAHPRPRAQTCESIHPYPTVLFPKG
jgi:Fe-S-cluster containining protein